ncbi:DUF2793 domain-containing protein [Altericroceibacterium xinjiangense]|uniref:DUF2793 domain-containing protein n=1 Tax=Altericroceibacterium xinjiangense TaxID=762261 RepID=UPI000F7F5612|nr:DUF2793 domain-containing protein [Altericroceibacterium xinjiangense]
MSEPFRFTSASPRFGLPLLFAAQAQKEFFINEAHSLADALLHPAIEGKSATPPASPADGDCWLVEPEAIGDWTGHDGAIACRQAGSWLFIAPRDGMRVLDRSTGQEIRFRNGWQRPARPESPTGGTTIDVEARTAIASLITLLTSSGILPES